MLEAGELGCANGYYNLGVCYRIGDGVDVVEIDKTRRKLNTFMNYGIMKHGEAIE